MFTVSYHMVHEMPLITQPMILSVVSINVGKYSVSHRHDEAMLFVMVKACVCCQIILLFRALKDYFLLMYGYKQNQKPSSTSSSMFTFIFLGIQDIPL